MNKRIKITEDIIKAIRAAIEKYGSQVEIEALSGINHQNFSRYLSGAVKSMESATYSSLFPVVKEFLPPKYHTLQINHNNHNSVIHQNHYAPNQELEAYRKKLVSTFTKTDKLDPETRLKVLDIINEL